LFAFRSLHSIKVRQFAGQSAEDPNRISHPALVKSYVTSAFEKAFPRRREPSGKAIALDSRLRGNDGF
jgi:hypothetical protein